MSNSIEIEEKLDLLIEVKHEDTTYFLGKLLVLNMIQINKLSLANLKVILFQYYLNKGDIVAYNRVNKRSKDCLTKINKCILEE